MPLASRPHLLTQVTFESLASDSRLKVDQRVSPRSCVPSLLRSRKTLEPAVTCHLFRALEEAVAAEVALVEACQLYVVTEEEAVVVLVPVQWQQLARVVLNLLQWPTLWLQRLR